MPAIEKYLDFLWNSLQFDIQTFSHGWMYYYLLVPAVGYFIFFILKWIVLTIPIWMPISLLMRFANMPPPRCRNCAYKTAQEFDFSDQAGENKSHEPGQLVQSQTKSHSFTKSKKIFLLR